MTHMQCHFNSFLCLISFPLTSSLTQRHSDCGLWTTSGLWGSLRWSGEFNTLGATLYLTDLREGNWVLQKDDFFLLHEWSPEQKNLRSHWVGEPFYFNFCWKKPLTVGFWTLVYILSVYRSQKALSLCKGRQNRAAEQHDQRVAERAGIHASFICLTLWGDFGQLDLIT